MSFASGSGLQEQGAPDSSLASKTQMPRIPAQETEVDSAAGDQPGNYSAKEDPEHQKPVPVQRCFSEEPSTPTSQKKAFQKSKSDPWGPLPLKSGKVWNYLGPKELCNRVYWRSSRRKYIV